MKYLPFLLFFLISTPFAASASTPRPTCSITATTPSGTSEFSRKGKISVKSGQRLELSWSSNNATKARDNDGNMVPLASSTISFPTQSTKYSYTFSAGSRKAICGVDVSIVGGSIDTDTLTTENTKPTLSGTADGTKTVHVEISSLDGKDSAFSSRTIRVKGGQWSVRLTKALPKGSYRVVIYGDKNVELNELATGTLTIGTTSITNGNASGTGSFSASAIPLLSGGYAAPGSSVPVSYLKLVNASNTTTTLPGIWLKQNGTAPISAIIGFSTVDDKAVSRTSVGGTEGSTLFGKNGLAYVPLNATFAPGQFRIFTIKAQMSRNIASYYGSSVTLDVASLDTNGRVGGSFPIHGTTWILRAY